MLQKKRLGVHIFSRGIKGGIRSINTPIYDVSPYDFLNLCCNTNSKNFPKYKYSKITSFYSRGRNKTN